MSLILTLFSFNVDATQDVRRRVRTKVIEGKCPWIYQIVLTFNRQSVFYRLLNTHLMPTFEVKPSLHWVKREAKESVTIIVNTTKLKTMGRNTNAPKVGVLHRQRNLEISPNPYWRESQNRPRTQRKILISNT